MYIIHCIVLRDDSHLKAELIVLYFSLEMNKYDN